MKEDKTEMVLNHCTSKASDILQLVIVGVGGCFYGAYYTFHTYPYLSYFCIAFAIVFGGFFSRMWFSKGAFLKLSPLGFELKTPIHTRVKKIAWSEIEKLQIEVAKKLGYKLVKALRLSASPTPKQAAEEEKTSNT